MTTTTHYKHSGKAPFGGILLTFVGGVLGGISLGLIYGFLIGWSPFVYINFFITLGFGMALAMLIGSLAKRGKIRNVKLLSVLALLVSLPAYYAHWTVWIGQVTEVQTVEPGQLWQYIKVVAMLGPWSIFGWTPSGGALWAIWAVEALMIIGIAVLVAPGMIDIPFCEKTNQWTEERNLPQHFQPITQAADTPRALLAALKPASQTATTYTEVSIASASGSQLRCVSLKSVEIETKDDKEQSKETVLVRNMLFDPHSFAQLLKLGEPEAAS